MLLPPPPHVRELLARAGQPEVLRFWEQLSAEERRLLEAAVKQLEPGVLRAHCQEAAMARHREQQPAPNTHRHMKPLPGEVTGSSARTEPQSLRGWRERGEGLGGAV
eukprot:g12177.t1